MLQRSRLAPTSGSSRRWRQTCCNYFNSLCGIIFWKTRNFISLICSLLSWGLWYVSSTTITETCTRNYPTAQESTSVLTYNALHLSTHYMAFFFLWSYKTRSKRNCLKYHDAFLDWPIKALELCINAYFLKSVMLLFCEEFDRLL